MCNCSVNLGRNLNIMIQVDMITFGLGITIMQMRCTVDIRKLLLPLKCVMVLSIQKGEMNLLGHTPLVIVMTQQVTVMGN